MKKRVCCLLVGLVMAVLLALGTPSVGSFALADSTPKQFSVLPANISGLQIPEEKVSNAPVDNTNGVVRMAGSSVLLSQDKNELCYFVNDEIDLENVFAETNIYGATVGNLYLSVWVYFGSSTLKDLSIGFSNADGTVKMMWNLTSDMLAQLMERAYSDYEYTVYGDNVPYGWNNLCLPVSKATITGDISATITGEENTVLFNFTKMVINQDETKVATCPLKIYDAKFIEGSLPDYACVVKNKAVYISFKSDAFSELLEQELYTREYISFPSVRDVFSACYVGEEDYLLATDLTAKFKLRVDSGNGEPTLYDFGSGNFKLRSNSISVKPCIIRPGSDNVFLNLKTITLKATDYGSGVWFLDKNLNVNVGDTFNIRYTVHKAFASADINFESVDPETLEIVSVDAVNQVVKVKALKKGNANIKVTVNDGRLLDTDFAETGLSAEVVVTVKKAAQKKNSTYIFFIVCFAVIAAGGTAWGVYSIVKSRKMEVK